MINGLNVVPDNEMDLHDVGLQGGQTCSACGAQPYVNAANGWTTIHNPIEKPDEEAEILYGDV
jgi:hypothetical protein